MGVHHFCTIKQAEELAHAAYLLGRKEEAKARHEMALAFEARIKGIEENLAAVAREAGIHAIARDPIARVGRGDLAHDPP